MTAGAERRKAWSWAALALLLLATAAVRIRLLDVPLERDEGEYAYAGQLILQGIAPYSLVYDFKLPGTYAAYAALMAVFGQTTRGAHLGLLTVDLATVFFVFLLGRRLLGEAEGLVAAAFFAFLALGRGITGFAGNAEHYVLLFLVPAVIQFLKAVEDEQRRGLFLSAVLFGAAILMKQHALVFAACAGAFLLAREGRAAPRAALARAGIFAGGVMLPYAATCLTLAAAGVFPAFWFWTVTYARAYVSRLSLAQGWAELRFNLGYVLDGAAPLWGLAALGVPALLLDRRRRRVGLWLSGLLLASALAVSPGLYYRNHYFLLMLPAVSLLAAAAARSLSFLLGRSWPAAAALVLLLSAYRQREYLFQLTPAQVSRSLYGANPFPESLEIARFIRERTTKADRIAVLGSEPQIYFYADRLSATGHVFTYGLMEKQPHALRMQEEMIAEIERARPKFVVLVNVATSWLRTPDSEQRIFRWIDEYVPRHYDVAGIVDIVSLEETVYRWEEDAAGYRPSGANFVLVFRRKGGPGA